jgi:hypothetical protein
MSIKNQVPKLFKIGCAKNFTTGCQAEWLKRLNANGKVATVLGSIHTFLDTIESEGRQLKQC